MAKKSTSIKATIKDQITTMLAEKKGSFSSANKLSLPAKAQIALVYRLETVQAVSLAQKVAKYLSAKGYEVFTAPEQKTIPGTKALKSGKALDGLSLTIVLGGDGTYLRAVRLLEGRRVPVLGFNMGSLGFLTAHNAESTFEVIDEAIAGKMVLRHRSMIHAVIKRGGKKREEFHALNDMVIERGSMSQLINTSIHSDGFLVSHVKADGFIIASPSGSTAYNLAAGGPLLHPESPVLVVTPVAPHALTSRPLIFPDHGELAFKLEGKTQKAHFIVDGQKQAEITAQDEVLVTRSCYDHLMVRSAEHNFFHLLREKLKFGDRN